MENAETTGKNGGALCPGSQLCLARSILVYDGEDCSACVRESSGDVVPAPLMPTAIA
jgi:hypothetical protein